MVQGTASAVGKSLLVTGLCRRYARMGLRVRPFKAQNMALNSFVTRAGHEIGRSQAVQAEAAGVPATVEMNPILIKPEGAGRSQVIVAGLPIEARTAAEQFAAREELVDTIADSLTSLRATSDLVVIEGAGSPAEINLRERDLVNMYIAHLAEAPVLLVGDIDRGGVFAHFHGTLGLLEERDRARFIGLVINKFRGDVELLHPAPAMIEARTGVPVLGILPWLPKLRIADEDSVCLEDRPRRARAAEDEFDIAVARTPRISNYDDFLAFEHEAGVVVRFVESAREAEGADLLILPGSKNTRADLHWLESVGLARVVHERAAAGRAVLGVCGGFQMLGESIDDPLGIEGPAGRLPGLGLLPIRTEFGRQKCTRQTRSQLVGRAPMSAACAREAPGAWIDGYEIHNGRILYGEGAEPWFRREPEAAQPEPEHAGGWDARGEGCWRGSVAGTILHGIFENDALRRGLLQSLGWKAPATPVELPSADSEYDRLADVLERSMDFARIDAHVFGGTDSASGAGSSSGVASSATPAR